ncbi:hypothetical protein ACQ5SO_10425 [Rhodovulum sp. DZ06]|uniref:hypothetical protein n=1 Tax=Rhodovulum sp. DZ06 TaxID=3425126 RepID=UPI003D33D744
MQVLYRGEPDTTSGPGESGFFEADDDGVIPEGARPYVPFEFGRLELACVDVELRRDLPVFTGAVDDHGDLEAGSTAHARAPHGDIAVVATGVVQASGYGRYSLSFFGRARRYDTVRVSVIRTEEPAAQRAYFAGMKPDRGFDGVREGGFYLQANLAPDVFDMLVAELSAPDAELHASVEVMRFPGFYAEWSPSVDEGRPIKFLDRPTDIANLDETPEAFLSTRQRKDEIWKDDPIPPASLTVRTRLGSASLPDREEDEWPEGDAEEDELDAERLQSPTREDWMGFMFRTEATLNGISKAISWMAMAVFAGLIAFLSSLLFA